MAETTFSLYLSRIIESLNKHNVDYKLVGGSIVQLIDNTRETKDLDLLVQDTQDNLNKLIDALVSCEFATAEEVRYQIYGDDETTEGYNAFQLVPSNPLWSDFHIDMCLKLGQYSYDTSPTEVHTTETGLQINSVPFRYIAHMKANVFPQPRPQDHKDIKIIADHLGLDPATGEPKK
jgi:hypothetical protein